MDKKHGERKQKGLRARKPARSTAQIKEPQPAAHHALVLMIDQELKGMCGFSGLKHAALTQHDMKRSLETHGQAASDAVMKQMEQLQNQKTIRPRASKDLAPEEKQRALACLVFIKEKRHGTIKASGCADGRKQRLHETKEETSPPQSGRCHCCFCV
jgi:hypothetical protein